MPQLDLTTPVRTLGGQDTTLEPFHGQVLLVVNTASRCAFTPQYAGLEALHNELGDKGLTVLGFPCNQFGAQEPGAAGEIGEFCRSNYGVSFPMFDKVEVNGEGAHPVFKQLKAGAPGLFGSQSIKWNFTKFLVGRDGTVLKRFGPRTAPGKLRGEIEAILEG